MYVNRIATARRREHDGNTWNVTRDASSADRSVSIGCRRFERHPVVVMSFVARLETVHAIFRHARSVYLSKSPDRLGWVACRSWRASRPINLLRHRVADWTFGSLNWFLRKRAPCRHKKRKSRARGKKSSQTRTSYKKSPAIPVVRDVKYTTAGRN